MNTKIISFILTLLFFNSYGLAFDNSGDDIIHIQNGDEFVDGGDGRDTFVLHYGFGTNVKLYDLVPKGFYWDGISDPDNLTKEDKEQLFNSNGTNPINLLRCRRGVKMRKIVYFGIEKTGDHRPANTTSIHHFTSSHSRIVFSDGSSLVIRTRSYFDQPDGEPIYVTENTSGGSVQGIYNSFGEHSSWAQLPFNVHESCIPGRTNLGDATIRTTNLFLPDRENPTKIVVRVRNQ